MHTDVCVSRCEKCHYFGKFFAKKLHHGCLLGSYICLSSCYAIVRKYNDILHMNLHYFGYLSEVVNITEVLSENPRQILNLNLTRIF